jgi:DNA-binding transcriptional MerR regulator
MRLKIGELARLGQVTIETLRHYDDVDLLKPVEVDRFTQYRYYSIDQLARLNQILALRDLGVSLDQIRRLISENPSNAELRRILETRQSELRSQVQNDLDRLERIENRIRLLAEPTPAPVYDVVLKSSPELRIASVRGRVAEYSAVTPLWQELCGYLSQSNIVLQEPVFTLCHATEPEIELEVCTILPQHTPVHIRSRVLPAEPILATAIHRGSFTGLAAAFSALFRWVDDNHYEITGPDREIYHRLPPDDPSASSSNAVTELQIPVRKL